MLGSNIPGFYGLVSAALQLKFSRVEGWTWMGVDPFSTLFVDLTLLDFVLRFTGVQSRYGEIEAADK